MDSSLFKLLPVATATAFLAACGGNDAVAPPDAPPIPWASPAMIVPPGAASKTIPLTECGSGFQTVTLIVSSSGDMILSGAPSGTTTISELNRINYATATSVRVTGQNNPSGPTAEVFLSIAPDYINASVSSSGGRFHSIKSTAPPHDFRCTLVNGSASFALTTLPSSARLANQMTNGITGIDTSSPPGTSATFVSGVATWDQSGSGTSPYRHVQLNVNTGAMGSSATSTGTFVTTAITLPTTPTSTSAYFQESIYNGNKGFYTSIQQTSGTFLLNIERIANLLKPGYSD